MKIIHDDNFDGIKFREYRFRDLLMMCMISQDTDYYEHETHSEK